MNYEEQFERGDEINEEEAYVEFTMMEINEFIARYGAKFFLSRLKYPQMASIIRELV